MPPPLSADAQLHGGFPRRGGPPAKGEKTFMSDFSDFLEQLLRGNGYSVYGFAQEAGLDRPTLHRVLKGQLTPSSAFFQKIIKTLRLFPQERDRLTYNYHILKNGERIFSQRLYIKARLEELRGCAAYAPCLPAGRESWGETSLPAEPVLCIRGEYHVESILRRVLLEAASGQDRPLLSTNLLESPPRAEQALLQLYLETGGQVELRHLIRFHKSIGANMHNLAMLFDALLFSFAPGDGYRPYFYYETISQFSDPSALFHSYLLTEKHVLCFAEDLKVAALIQEPGARACYAQSFQRTIAGAEPLLRRAASLEEGYQLEEAFYQDHKAQNQFSVSGCFPCLFFCCSREALQAIGKFEQPRVRALFEATCRHYERLAQAIKTCVAVTTVESFRDFLERGRVAAFPDPYVRPFDLPARILIMERLLSRMREGRVRLFLMNPARIAFPEHISIHVSEGQKCVVYAKPSDGHAWGASVEVKEKTLREALFDFVVSLPESELVYTQRESEEILRNLIQAARGGEEQSDV